MIGVFLFNQAVLDLTGLYELYPFLDIPMHIIGGAATAWTVVLIKKIFGKQYHIEIKPQWVWHLFILCAVGAFAIGWEFYEFIHDLYFPLQYQVSVADTVGDLFAGFIGALSYIVIKRP